MIKRAKREKAVDVVGIFGIIIRVHSSRLLVATVPRRSRATWRAAAVERQDEE